MATHAADPHLRAVPASRALREVTPARIAAPTLRERVGPIVEAFAHELAAVRRAYVRNDGAEFLLLGDRALPEMAESAARLSLALQDAFAPDYATYIDGGYEAVMDRPVSGYTLVFERA